MKSPLTLIFYVYLAFVIKYFNTSQLYFFNTRLCKNVDIFDKMHFTLQVVILRLKTFAAI